MAVVAIVTIFVVIGGGYMYINKGNLQKNDQNVTPEVLDDTVNSSGTLPVTVRQNNKVANTAIKPKTKTATLTSSGNEVSAAVKAEMQKAIDDINTFLVSNDKAVLYQLKDIIFLEDTKERLERNLMVLNSADEKMKEQVKKLDPDLFSEFAIRVELLSKSKEGLSQARVITDAAKKIGFVASNRDPRIFIITLDEYGLESYKKSPEGKSFVSAKVGDSLIFFFDIDKAVIYRGSSVVEVIDGFKDTLLL